MVAENIIQLNAPQDARLRSRKRSPVHHFGGCYAIFNRLFIRVDLLWHPYFGWSFFMNDRLIFAHQKSDPWFKWFLVTGGLFFIGHLVYAVAVGVL